MKGRLSALYLLFPILGSLAAFIFRPSEKDLRHFAEPQKLSIARDRLSIPGFPPLRLLGVPEASGDIAFWLAETETPAALWRKFRPDSLRERGAASGMTQAEAKAFCNWLSEKSGRVVRLPSPGEWRLAARAGRSNTEFPWGFGADIPKGLAFALDQKPRRPGPAFGYGFRDLAGGLWEWSAQEGQVLGAAWSERNPQRLRIHADLELPRDYAGADTGFRVLVEVDKSPESARTSP